MRRLTLALSAVFVSTAVALVASLFAASEVSQAGRAAQDSEASAGRAQYQDPDYVGPPQGVDPTGSEAETSGMDYYTFYNRWLSQAGDFPEVGNEVSEGSAPAPRAPAKALAVMEPPAAYSRVVDNASPRRFSARGWEEGSRGALHYGEDYGYVGAARDVTPARFRVKIPATDHYTVYARWPVVKGNSAATRFGISTPSGIKWTVANQRRDGGMWVRLGAYEMEEGIRYAVRVSRHPKSKGRVVADAIMVVRGTQMALQQGDTGKEAAGDSRLTGREVVRLARAHIGTPYRHSPPLPCEPFRSEDCSCLTKTVFSEALSMPDDPVAQWEMGEKVARPDLLPGDLVFFKEAGESNPITHVAIYSGAGNIVHASSYWGRVVERPMEHVSGYYGAKRLS
jgi:NlpC/P60 family